MQCCYARSYFVSAHLEQDRPRAKREANVARRYLWWGKLDLPGRAGNSQRIPCGDLSSYCSRRAGCDCSLDHAAALRRV